MIDFRRDKKSTSASDAKKAFKVFITDSYNDHDGLLELAANEAADKIKTGLLRGSMHLRKNAAVTAKNKKAKGQKSAPLVATSEYANSILATRLARGLYKVGVRKGKHRSGLTYDQLGNIHEYGRKGVPPRPHFLPEFRLTQHALRQAIASQVAKAKAFAKTRSAP